jgi:hypothetical protein
MFEDLEFDPARDFLPARSRVSTRALDLSPDDALAVEDSGHFRKRFKFEVNSKEARTEILLTKNTYRLTDRDITVAKWTGALKVDCDFIELRSSRWMMVLGWVQIVPVAAVGIAAMCTFLWKAPMTMRPIGLLLGLFAAACGAVFLMYTFYLRANIMFSQRRLERCLEGAPSANRQR